MRPLRPRHRSGLTLLEVLALMAIVAVLALLIRVAVVSSGSGSGKRAHCGNNLSQLNKLVYLYTATYGGYLPAFWRARWVGEMGLVGARWGELPDDVNPGVPVVWNNDPASRKALAHPGFPVRSGAPVLVCKEDKTGFRCEQGCLLSYVGLAKYGWWHPGAGAGDSPTHEYKLVQDIDNATRRIMLVETTPGWQSAAAGRPPEPSRPVEVAPRHHGCGHILFFDGHVQIVKDPEKRRIRFWEPDYDKVTPGWRPAKE